MDDLLKRPTQNHFNVNETLMLHQSFQELNTQLEFCLEKNRRATFKSWVFKDDVKCNASKLAEAGFVFSGTKHDPDSVTCFLCKKSLDCWDEDDDPWREHQKHAPKCLFAKMDKPEMTLTLSEFIDIYNESIEKFYENFFTRDRQDRDNLRNQILKSVQKLFLSSRM